MKGPMRIIPVRTIAPEIDDQRLDMIAVEEPLEIRLGGQAVSVTMRTPGHDRELAVGFLFTEGLLRAPEEIAALRQPAPNVLAIDSSAARAVDPPARNFFISSSCGICGKASLEALEAAGCSALPQEAPSISAAVLRHLPSTLRDSQAVFEKTGGLHAAALFDFDGRLISAREDVGRHNAVDKLIGGEFLAGRIPLADRLLLVSGRISFELVQKALMAGIPALAAVGAPSSLAAELALRFRMTLIGFLRDNRFNVYSGLSRIQA